MSKEEKFVFTGKDLNSLVDWISRIEREIKKVTQTGMFDVSGCFKRHSRYASYRKYNFCPWCGKHFYHEDNIDELKEKQVKFMETENTVKEKGEPSYPASKIDWEDRQKLEQKNHQPKNTVEVLGTEGNHE